MTEEIHRNQRYYADAISNYLIMRCPQDSTAGYQYRMLAANRIPGILPCSLRIIDGEEYLYYDVTSKETLRMKLADSEMSGQELRRFLYAMAAVIRSLSDYLLDESGLILGPEFIFYDFVRDQFCFTYYPEEQKGNGLQELFRYLAGHVQTDDRKSVSIIYRLCDLAAKPSFVLKEDLLDQDYESEFEEAEEEYDTESLIGTGYEGYGEEQDGTDRLFYSPSQDKVSGESSSKEEGRKREKNSRGTGRILALAVLFLTGAGALEASRFAILYDENGLSGLRAGIIACLGMALITAGYGVFYTCRKNREEERTRREKEQEEKRNAMMPAAEYRNPTGSGLRETRGTRNGVK